MRAIVRPSYEYRYNWLTPNDPNYNSFTNISPFDFAKYWELSNAEDSTWYYFQVISDSPMEEVGAGKAFKMSTRDAVDSVLKDTSSWQGRHHVVMKNVSLACTALFGFVTAII